MQNVRVFWITTAQTVIMSGGKNVIFCVIQPVVEKMCAILAVICIPWMLLVKPLYLLCRRNSMRRQVMHPLCFFNYPHNRQNRLTRNPDQREEITQYHS